MREEIKMKKNKRRKRKVGARQSEEELRVGDDSAQRTEMRSLNSHDAAGAKVHTCTTTPASHSR